MDKDKNACLQPKTCPFILVGDFNCPNIDWNNNTFPVDPVQNLLYDFVLQNNISQFVLEPTHLENILDVVLSNERYSVQNVELLPNLGKSE